MAIRLLFDFTKSIDTDISEIDHLLDEMDIIDNSFIENKTIYAINNEGNTTDNNINEKITYVFNSVNDLQTYLNIFNQSEIKENWKLIYDCRIRKNFLLKLSIDYNYAIS